MTITEILVLHLVKENVKTHSEIVQKIDSKFSYPLSRQTCMNTCRRLKNKKLLKIKVVLIKNRAVTLNTITDKGQEALKKFKEWSSKL